MVLKQKSIFAINFNKIMQRFTLLFLFFFITGINNLQSQTAKVWTLQQCIEHALKNNLQVKQGEFNKQIAEQNLLQTKASVLPNLSLNASNFYNFGQTIDPFTNQFVTERARSDRYSISGGMNLFSGFQQYNSIKQGELNLFAAKHDLDRIKNDISLSIANAYLQIIFAMEQLKNAELQANITKQQLNRSKMLFESGSVARNTVIDLEAQLANEELNIVNAQNQVDLSKLNLALQLDLKSTEEFTVAIPEIADPTADLITVNADYLFNTAMGNQPSVKAAETRIKAAEKNLSVTKGAIYPTISIGGSVGSGYSGLAKQIAGATPQTIEIGQTILGEKVFTTQFIPILEDIPYRNQLDRNFNRNFGFQLQFPIFNGLTNYTNINRSKINLAGAKNDLEIAKRDLKQNVFRAHADALAAYKKYNATKQAYDAGKLSFENTETRFTLGAANSYEFNDAKNRLSIALSNMNQAKFDYIFKVKVLDFYLGKPITL